MKATKRILSSLLALCVVIGCVSVSFSALAAPTTLQAAIDQALAAGETSLDWDGTNVTEKIVINTAGDFTLDLGNATVTAIPKNPGIRVIGTGNVTIQNGTVIADFGSYSGTEFLSLIDTNTVCAIKVQKGNVTVKNVFAMGALLRVPGAKTTEIPVGDGIELFAGASLTVENSCLVGMFGIDNYTGPSPVLAPVHVKDAILVGWYDSVRKYSAVTYDSGTTIYDGIDVFEALLKDGISLSENERTLVDKVADTRVRCIFKNPTVAEPTTSYNPLTEELVVTALADDITGGADVKYSYKWAPFVCTVNGESADFTTVDGVTYTAAFENVEVGTAAFDVDYKLLVDVNDRKAFFETIPAKLSSYANKLGDYVLEMINKGLGLVEPYLSVPNSFYQFYGAVKNELVDAYSATPVPNEWINSPEWAQVTELVQNIIKVFGMRFFTVDETRIGDPVWEDYYTRLAAIPVDRNGYDVDLSANAYGIYGELMTLLEDGIDISHNQGVGELALYVFDKYDDLLDILDEVGVILSDLYDIFTTPGTFFGDAVQDYIDAEIAEKRPTQFFGTELYFKNLIPLFGKLNDAYASVLSMGHSYLSSDYVSGLINTYGANADYFAEKAFYIATHFEKYFGLDMVENDYAVVDLGNFDIQGTFDVTAEFRTVTVTVSGLGAAKLTASFGGETQEFLISSIGTYILPYGSTITIEEQVISEDLPLLYWTYGSTERFCDKKEYTLVNSMSFNACFDDELYSQNDSHVVYFLSSAQNTLWSFTLAAGEPFDIPVAPPAINGYTFLGWVEGTTTYVVEPGKTLPVTILTDEAIYAFTEHTFVSPAYRKDAQYAVSFDLSGFGATAPAVTGAGAFAVKDAVTVKAPSQFEGKKFSYWMNSKGEIVSYDLSHSFIIVEDVTFIPVYNGSVTKAPLVNVTTVVASTNTIYAERYVPDGYTIIQTGILATKDAAIAADLTQFNLSNGAKIEDNTIRVGMVKSTPISLKGTYGLSFASTSWYGRGYIVYAADANPSELLYVYSDVITFA